MSVLQLFSNNGVALLAAPLTPFDLTISLPAGYGQHFPMPTNPGEFFLVTLEDIASPSIREIIRITGRAGDILIIDSVNGRAQEQTIARNWAADDTLVDHRVTAETMRQAFLQPLATGGSTGSSLITADENSNLTTATSKLNFVGAGVTATATGDNVTITIPGSTAGSGGVPLITADENVTLSSSTAKLNFVGAGVTATASGDNITITIPGSTGSAGGNSLIVADENLNLTTTATKINFVGAGVTATNIGTDITVTIPGSSGGGNAGNGVVTSTPPVLVERGWTIGVTECLYSDFKRSFKFWVTLFDTVSGNTEAFEVFAVIQGHLSANTETVTWTRSNRIGFNFLGQVNLELNRPLNTLSLSWANNELLVDVLVSCTYLQ